MSGTSLDGVDAAILETDGAFDIRPGPSAFFPYGAEEREALRAALGQWDGPEVAAAAEVVDAAHARAVAAMGAVAVVGYHGQTLVHAPPDSLQVGDGRRLGAPCVWDFRSADLASGGQGAPLVPFYHHARVRAAGLEDVAVVNIGGVANVTFVGRGEAPEAPGVLTAFDTGPGNALIDDFVRARTGAACDLDGALGLSGRVHEDVVQAVLADPWFLDPPPKSLDRDAWGRILAAVEGLSTSDGAATLAAITAGALVAAVRFFPRPAERWIVAGGGRRNRAILAALAGRTNRPVDAAEAVGWDGDMLEAEAFAWLAVRVLRGLPTSGPTTTGARLPVSGGRVFPPGLSVPP